jgi:hypothetical protein
MVINPGDSWTFARPKTENPKIIKFTVEIVASEVGEATGKKYPGNIDEVGKLVLETDEELKESEITYVQAIFFDSSDRIVGVTSYATAMAEEEAETDLNIDNERALNINENTILFNKPIGVSNLTWTVFVN